jgi:hypothetical protein
MSYDYTNEPMQDTFTTGFTIASLILTSCIAYPIIFAFLKRRNLPFFVQRGFWTTFIFILSAYIPHIVSIIMILGNGPCYLWGMLDFGVTWMFMTSAERGFLLYVHFNLGIQAKDYVQNLDADKAEKGWILKHRAWFHHGLFSITKLVTFICAVLLALPGWLKINSSSHGNVPFWSVECRAIAVDLLWNIAIFLICISVASLFGMYLLRKVADNYWIKLELILKTFSFVGFSGLIFMVLTPSVYNSIKRPIYLILQETYYGFVTVTFVAMGLIVILYERRQKSIGQGTTSSSGTELDSSGIQAQATSELAPSPKVSQIKVLEMILGNDNAIRCLENFLLKELSIENLLFVRAVQNLQNGGKTAEELVKTENQIYLKFISPSADLEVNISHPCRIELEAAFKNMKKDGADPATASAQMLNALDKTKKEIMNLMANDSLRRFCRTPEFRALGMSLVA